VALGEMQVPPKTKGGKMIWVWIYLFIGAILMSHGFQRQHSNTKHMNGTIKVCFAIAIWIGWLPMMVWGIFKDLK